MDQSCPPYEACSGYICQIQEIETQARFDVMELPIDPKGVKFFALTYAHNRYVIGVEYEVINRGGYLYLYQGIGDYQSMGEWDEVPVEEVQQVTVNGQYAELASDTFVAFPDATEAVCRPGSRLRLRWRESARWFSLEKMGDPYPIEWMDEAALIGLAESLVNERDINADIPVAPEYLGSIEAVEAVEALAGFEVPAPAFLPERYEFKRAAWMNDVVQLMYGPKTSSDELLHFFIGAIDDYQIGPCVEELCPPERESVQIGNWEGWYWRGTFVTDPIIAGQPEPTPVWDADSRE